MTISIKKINRNEMLKEIPMKVETLELPSPYNICMHCMSYMSDFVDHAIILLL